MHQSVALISALFALGVRACAFSPSLSLLPQSSALPRLTLYSCASSGDSSPIIAPPITQVDVLYGSRTSLVYDAALERYVTFPSPSAILTILTTIPLLPKSWWIPKISMYGFNHGDIVYYLD